MQVLRITLVGDGSSDQALLPILVWMLREHYGRIPIQPDFADLRRLPNPPRELFERIAMSIELYPCDLLFVHRDAEREPIENRRREIHNALERCEIGVLPVVCVIPVRMQEAWLLIDGPALRRAVGNPQGRQPLELPDLRGLEGLPNPKETLYELLGTASGLSGRRKRRFKRDVNRHVHRVAEEIDDFGPLRALRAFRQVESDVISLRQNCGLFD